MTRCASPLSNFPPKGERAIASSPASGRGLRRGEATGAVITASYLLMELLAIPLSQQAGKWLVIPQTAGYAITSDLASVNQRLMSPCFGDLAEWLCKAVCSPSRMAITNDLAVVVGQPSQMASCFTSSYISNVSEVRL